MKKSSDRTIRAFFDLQAQSAELSALCAGPLAHSPWPLGAS